MTTHQLQLIGGPWHGQTVATPFEPGRHVSQTGDDGRQYFYRRGHVDPTSGTQRYYIEGLTWWKPSTWVVLGDDGHTPPTPYRTNQPTMQGGDQ